MALSEAQPPAALLSRLRRRPRRPAALGTLLAYLLVSAILPQGFMAAPLASGTPFHLCPDDARSAQLLAALSTLGRTGPHALSDDHAADQSEHEHASGHGTHASASSHHTPGADGAHLASESGFSHTMEHGGQGSVAVDSSGAEANCGLAGVGAVALLGAPPEYDSAVPPPGVPPVAGSAPRQTARWLRPPVRSPPV